MRLLHFSEYIVILGAIVFLVGCESNLTPDSDKLERAHPASVGSTFTFDSFPIDSLGNMPDDEVKYTLTDSIISNGESFGARSNVTTYMRTIKCAPVPEFYYHNFEPNGDLSECHRHSPMDSLWTTFPIESRTPIIKNYYDSNTKTGTVKRQVTTIEYDSTVSVVIRDTTLRAHKIRTTITMTVYVSNGDKNVYVFKSYHVIAPSIGYIVEWRNDPPLLNGYFDGKGSVSILRDYHIQ